MYYAIALTCKCDSDKACAQEAAAVTLAPPRAEQRSDIIITTHKSQYSQCSPHGDNSQRTFLDNQCSRSIKNVCACVRGGCVIVCVTYEQVCRTVKCELSHQTYGHIMCPCAPLTIYRFIERTCLWVSAEPADARRILWSGCLSGRGCNRKNLQQNVANYSKVLY